MEFSVCRTKGGVLYCTEIAIEPWLLPLPTPRSVSCRTGDLSGPGFIVWHDELSHHLDLHIKECCYTGQLKEILPLGA